MNAYTRLFAFVTVSSLCSVAPGAVDFARDLAPIFEKSCINCHSVKKDKVKGKFAVDDMAHLGKTIALKKLIIPGDPKGSRILEVVNLPQDDDDAMPPRSKGDPLTTEQKAVLTAWIQEGALLPGGAAAIPDKTAAAATPATAPATPAAPVAGPTKWTNSEGVTITAAFGGLQGDNVILIMDGKNIPYPLSKLSPESQAQAKAATK